MIEKLYEKYHLELVRWCQGMTDNLQTAEELVQEAFLRAMIHEDMLIILDENQCRAWLYRTVKNLYVDRIRHTSRETIVDEFHENQKIPEEMENVEWEDILNSLPDMEGVLFAMRYLQGYNSTQIGEIFSMSPGTVRSKLSSARKHLQKAIGGNSYV